MSEFESGFKQPSTPFNYATINPLLFLSKSNYDQIKDDKRYSEILTNLGAQNIYTETNLSNLTTVLRVAHANDIIVAANTIALYNFHNTVWCSETFTLSNQKIGIYAIMTL